MCIGTRKYLLSKVFENVIFGQVSSYVKVTFFFYSHFAFRKPLVTFGAIGALVSKIQELFQGKGFAWATFVT